MATRSEESIYKLLPQGPGLPRELQSTFCLTPPEALLLFPHLLWKQQQLTTVGKPGLNALV